ncbi:MAG: hypothetical protein ABIA47_03370 [bacterium]
MQDIRKIKPVTDFLLNIDIYDRMEEIAGKHSLKVERSTEFLDLTDPIIRGDLELGKMPAMIASAFGVDEGKAKLIAADVAGYRLLPLEAYMPGVAKQIKDWGGKIADYPKKRVVKEQTEEKDAIVALAEKIGLELPDHLMKRFIYLSKAYLTKERARDATATLMKRPLTIGGLGLNDEQVEKLLGMLDRELGAKEVKTASTELKPESDELKKELTVEPKAAFETIETFETKFPKPKPKVEEVITKGAEATAKNEEVKIEKKPEPEVVVTKDDLVAILKEDVVESGKAIEASVTFETKPEPEPKRAEKVKEVKLRDDKKSLPAKSVTHALTKSVPVISGSILDDQDEAELAGHAKKLEKREVKEDPEFKKKLEAEVNEMLKPAIAIFKKKKIAQQVFKDVAGQYVRGFRGKLRTEQLLKDKHKLGGSDLDSVMSIFERARIKMDQVHRAEIKPKQEELKEDVAAREREVLDKRHAIVTGRMPTGPIESPMPDAQVSAARTKLEELKGQADGLDTEKLARAESRNMPKKAKAKLTVQSAPPQPEGKIRDIKFVPKLIGPVEELGTMTPAEFRRLSSDPVEAARKIEDKLILLEESAYEDRVRGVKAWRRSPISKLYLEMSSEALRTGVSVAEIATRRRNAGEESLSPAEIKTLISLNSRLKF